MDNPKSKIQNSKLENSKLENSKSDSLSKIWQKARHDPDFRRRFLQSSGNALAEEGFLLDDEEMAELRTTLETLVGLSERASYERIMALAHSTLW